LAYVVSDSCGELASTSRPLVMNNNSSNYMVIIHAITNSDFLDIGDSEYIKDNVSFIDVDSYRLRIFFGAHSLVTILPRPTPLLVFIHGLSGQINQFEPLLKYFGQVADVLAIDFPGCGGSPLIDRSWNLYTTESFVTILNRVIEEKVRGRKVVLVGHSLGTLVAGTLAMKLGDKCLAVVLLCPKAEISEHEGRVIRMLTRMPEFLWNFFRKRDRAYKAHLKGV
jgi:pimeloyl-ACP methyl ester carboxylesterase